LSHFNSWESFFKSGPSVNVNLNSWCWYNHCNVQGKIDFVPFICISLKYFGGKIFILVGLSIYYARILQTIIGSCSKYCQNPNTVSCKLNTLNHLFYKSIFLEHSCLFKLYFDMSRIIKTILEIINLKTFFNMRIFPKDFNFY
jgi:hypothetical protein